MHAALQNETQWGKSNGQVCRVHQLANGMKDGWVVLAWLEEMVCCWLPGEKVKRGGVGNKARREGGRGQG